MAHILIPTDLSPNSLEAARHAVALFGGKGNTFTILNAWMAPYAGASVLMSMDDLLGRESREGLADFTEQLKKELPLEDAEVRQLSMHGELASVIVGLQEDDPTISLVVMGTMGATGLKEVLMGSNTADVLRKSLRPVLAVPNQAEHVRPKLILVADDGNAVSTTNAEVLVGMARDLQAELLLVRVVVDGTAKDLPSAYKPFLTDIPHTFRTVKGKDVGIALNEVIVESKAGMVVMVHHKMGLIQGLFHKSASKQMALHATVPLLVLQQ